MQRLIPSTTDTRMASAIELHYILLDVCLDPGIVHRGSDLVYSHFTDKSML